MKTTHMDNGTKLLLLAVAAIITCIVCGIAFYVTREGKAAVNNSTNQFNKLTSSYQDIDLSIYDELVISGSEVKRLIKDVTDKNEYVSIKVITGMLQTSSYNYSYNTSTKSLESSGVTTLTTSQASKSLASYINESSNFKGEVFMDGNGNLICISFTQQK